MAQVNKISSFKSFTEVKNQEASMKLREENNAKRQETIGKIETILDEMGLTSLSELDEDKKQALINKMFGNVSEDESEDIEDAINKLGEPKKLQEGNAFIFAASKAKQEGKEEFEFNGKKYKVTLKKDTGLKEGNAFGDAVRNAKEAGETEFEFEGETYKVEESLNEGKHGMAKKLLKGIVDGNSSQAEGIKLSKELADHYLYWINTSPYGKQNQNLPLYMLINASFNWGIERGLDPKLKKELADLKASQKKNESTVSEAFYRLPKDVIGNELYLASQNLTNLYSSSSAGNDIDTGVIDSIIKQLNTVKKSAKKFNKPEEVVGTVYEAEKFKSTKDFEEFCEEIDRMPEVRIKRIMGKDYIDTPGGFRDEAEDYDNDIIEYMISNMGRKDFEKLQNWWENNVAESVVNEAASTAGELASFISQNAKHFASFLKPKTLSAIANGNIVEIKPGSKSFTITVDFDKKTIDTTGKPAWPESTSYIEIMEYVKTTKFKLNESVVNEAEVQSDDEFKEYAMTVLKKAFGDEFDETKAEEVANGILKKCDGDYGAAVGMLTSSLGESFVTEREEAQIGTYRYQGKSYPLYTDDEHNHYIKVNGRIIEVDESFVTEAFDANYWEDYQEGAKKMKNPTSMQLQQEVEASVEDWNDNNEEGPSNEVTPVGEKKVLKLAKEFVKAKGYISTDIIDAMIAQES